MRRSSVYPRNADSRDRCVGFEFRKVNFTIKKDTDGETKIERVPILEMPAELKQIIEEMG